MILSSQQVVLPTGMAPASVEIENGVIAAISSYDSAFDVGDVVLMPGLVDTHVHVNEPGRTEWEGFATATRAAAAGGVTTLVDMPLNSLPPTVSVEALEVKRDAAAGQCYVDVGFWGGAIGSNVDSLRPLYDAGVFGFKSFLIDSGVPEFPPLDPAGLDAALVAVPEGLFIVHAEDPASVAPLEPTRRYADFVASRPPVAEQTAVASAIAAARRRDARVHILHLSAATALPFIEAARGSGVRLTAETCPHYLALSAEEIPDGGTQFKCCPPIRSAENRDRLWQGLADGTIDCVVSDHSPSTPSLKGLETGDFATAWGGIASLQLGLSVVWTAAAERGHTLVDVVQWMARRPADLVGLRRKGRIEVGADADLVAFDPDATWVVDPTRLHHRNPVTPYAGATLRGIVRTTWLRGLAVDFVQPRGVLLTREA